MTVVVAVVAFFLVTATLALGSVIGAATRVVRRPSARLPVAYALGVVAQAVLVGAAVGAGFSGAGLCAAAFAPAILLVLPSARSFLWLGLVSLARVLGRAWHAGGASRAERQLVRMALLIAAGTWLADLVATLAPVTNADALKYHLPIVRQLASGTLAPIPETLESAGPVLAHLLLSPAYVVGGDQGAQALVPWHALLAFFGVVSFARVAGVGARASAVAGALVMSSLLMSSVATALYVEPFLMAVTGGGLVLAYPRRRTLAKLIATGAICGAIYGVKYTAGALVVVVCALVVGRARSKREAMVAGLVVVTAAAVTWAPWAVRGFVFVGDPHFPLFAPDTPAMAFAAAGVQRAQHLAASGLWSGVRLRWLAPLHPVAAPWIGQAFGYYGHWLGPLFVPGLYLAWLSHRERSRFLPFIVAYWLGGLPWAWVSPQVRLFWPVLGFVFVPVTAGVWRLVTHEGVWRQAVRATVIAVLLLQCLVGAAGAGARAAQSARYLVGLETRSEFLRTRAVHYSLHEQVSARIKDPSRARVLLPQVYPYHARYPHLATALAKPPEIAEREGKTLEQYLCDEGFTHIATAGRPARYPWIEALIRKRAIRQVEELRIYRPLSVARGTFQETPAFIARLDLCEEGAR